MVCTEATGCGRAPGIARPRRGVAIRTRYIDAIGCADRTARTGRPTYDPGRQTARGEQGRDPRAGSPRTAARVARARLRAAQAAQPAARLGPGALLRLALPGAEEDAARRAGHRGRDGLAPGCRAGSGSSTRSPRRARSTSPADDRGRSLRVGGRQLRHPVRVLLPHRHGDPAAHPRGSPYPAPGAARPGPAPAADPREATATPPSSSATASSRSSARSAGSPT